MQSFFSHLIYGFELAFSLFIDPNKRIFYGYLLTSFGLALGFYLSKGRYLGQSSNDSNSKLIPSNNKRQSLFINAIQFLFPKSHYFSQSTLVDLKFILINGLTKSFLILPFLGLGTTMAFYISHYLKTNLGQLSINCPHFVVASIYTVAFFLISDLGVYLSHRLYHQVPWLWRFHQIHHQAPTLTPLTQYRIHPIELILNNVIKMLIIGFITPIFEVIFKAPIDFIDILGVNMFSFLFFVTGANLRHSHIALNYPKSIEKIFISPKQHQLHHFYQTEKTFVNFGSKLSIWDGLFKTLALSSESAKIK